MSVLEVRDPKQIAALLHPLRQQIIDQLTRGVATPSEVARAIGIAASKAHYHVRILEKAGLVKLVETRQVGSVTETYFAAVARTFDIRTSLHEPGPMDNQVMQALWQEIDRTLTDLRRALDTSDSSHPKHAFATVETLSADEHGQAAADHLVERLHAKLALAREGRPGSTYRLLIALVPTETESPA